MKPTVFSEQDFNQNPNKARKNANKGPVFITEGGKPIYVLLSFELYSKLTAIQENIADLLAMPEDIDMELEIPKFNELARPADL